MIDTTAVAPTLRAIGRALPEHYYRTDTLAQALWSAWATAPDAPKNPAHERARFERIHRSAGVRGRHLALPLEAYAELQGSFAASNAAWTRAATDLGTEAVVAALATAGLEPRDVDHVFFNTVTGIASPSIDVKVINRLGMRTDVRRTPIFGLGCVGGAAGTARAADYLRAFPDEVAILLSVELCSLTLQLQDRSIANVIATALFGDGAAAVVLTGRDRAARTTGPRIVASRSLFFPDTEEIMGWEIADTGFRVVLTGGIPDLVRRELRGAVDGFLAEHGIARADVGHWLAHTGGPKVLRAMQDALELPAEALARSWKSLADVGNLSSASVLFVAADFLAAEEARPGDWGVLLSMGPGFCGELVLLQW
jgi:alkylresorcinol/alkylpyrone synthase